MHLAIAEAERAADMGEVPVGAAIIASDGALLATAGNRVECDSDPTAHAEMIAIRLACENLNAKYLEGCAIWVTLEPCAMCAAAISHARIKKLYFGAVDEKSGAVLNGAAIFNHPQCHHKPEIYDGIEAQQCQQMLRQFFAVRRQ